MVVTHIDKAYNLTRYTVSQVMAFALDPVSAGLPDDQVRLIPYSCGTFSLTRPQRKFMQKLADKLKYCKEVLVSIRSASNGEGDGAADPSSGSSNTAGTRAERPLGASTRDREQERAERAAERERERPRDRGEREKLPSSGSTATLARHVSKMSMR